MNFAKLFQVGVVWLTCFNMAATRVAAEGLEHAAKLTAAPTRPLVGDVALGEAGALRGVALDANNQPRAFQQITLWRDNQPLAEAVSDEHGRFAIPRIAGGVYTLRIADAIQVYRLWAPGTAPPHAQSEALLMASEPILRGQRPHPIYGLFQDPLVLGLIIAAAIAIPIAIHNLNDDDDDAS